MPGKHVHFGSQEEYSPPDNYYSPPPSPTFSSASPSSSDGPFTPPSLGSGSPYHYTPLPDLALILHPSLGVAGKHFEYDLSTPPMRNTTVHHPSYPITDTLWDQPISSPPVPYMELQCALLPWKLIITPSKHSPQPFVTIRDFFGCLYAALRRQVTPAEYDQVTSKQLRNDINNAYKRRYKRLPDYAQYEKEMAAGLRRVDFLGEYAMFDGLSCLGNSGVHWTLHVARPPPAHVLS